MWNHREKDWVLDRLSNPKLGKPLNEREERVMNLLSTGSTYQDVAKKLYFDVSMTEKVMRNVRRKLGATTTLRAMYLWASRG